MGSVVITQYSGQHSADVFKSKLEKLGIRVYIHYLIPGYPNNIKLILSDEGYGKNDYIETSRPLVVVTAPGPGRRKKKWQLASLSYTMNIREEFVLVMQNMKHFQSGIFR